MIDMECPHCKHPLRIDDQFAGQRGRCKHCNGEIVVGESSDESSETIPQDSITDLRKSWQTYLTPAQLKTVSKKVLESLANNIPSEDLAKLLTEIKQLNVEKAVFLKRFKAGIMERGAEGELLKTKVEEKHTELLHKLRAEIADVELRIASSEREFEKAKNQGKTYKIWITIGDDLHSDLDVTNEAQGWIPIDEAFASGHQTSPSEPNCRCTISYRKTAPDEASIARAEERIRGTQQARK